MSIGFFLGHVLLCTCTRFHPRASVFSPLMVKFVFWMLTVHACTNVQKFTYITLGGRLSSGGGLQKQNLQKGPRVHQKNYIDIVQNVSKSRKAQGNVGLCPLFITVFWKNYFLCCLLPSTSDGMLKKTHLNRYSVTWFSTSVLLSTASNPPPRHPQICLHI
jgi:hypothetical protein